MRRKELLPLDDDFAKEVSDLETLEALRDRVREDLQKGAEQEAEHQVRHELLQELASPLEGGARSARRSGDRPAARGVRQAADGTGHRPDEGEHRLAGVPRAAARAAAETVQSTLVLDEIARREAIEADRRGRRRREVERFAERAGRTPAAVRARLEKEGALDRIRAGIRREKTMAWLIEKAQIVTG